MDFISLILISFLSLMLFVVVVILSFKNPFWGVIFVMITHFWFGSIEAGVYPRILSIIFLVCSALPVLAVKKFRAREKIAFDHETKNILKIALLLYVWEIFINQVIHGNDFQLFISNSGKVLAPIVMAIVIYLFITDKKKVQYYVFAIISVISVSAVIGILQFFDIGWSWKLREFQGEVLYRPEPAGLALYSLLFAYQLAPVIPLLFSQVISKNISKPYRNLLWQILVVMLFALLTARVRSAFIGSIIGMVFVFAVARRYRRGIWGSLVVIAIIILFAYVNPLIFKEISNIRDESASARIPLFITAWKIAQDHLIFGISSGKYAEAAGDYYHGVSHMYGASTVLVTSSHNQFLNILDYYGVIGLLLLILFYYKILKNLIVVGEKTSNQTYKYLSYGLIGSHVSYIINSSFHNAGPFISDPYAWFYIGLSLVLFKYDKLK